MTPIVWIASVWKSRAKVKAREKVVASFASVSTSVPRLMLIKALVEESISPNPIFLHPPNPIFLHPPNQMFLHPPNPILHP
jgi:hypothetical protein